VECQGLYPIIIIISQLSAVTAAATFSSDVQGLRKLDMNYGLSVEWVEWTGI
jgi:hypothetical protein